MLGVAHASTKTIDNSRIVRQADPRASRDLWSLLLLIALIMAGVGLYAWPHFQIRQTGLATSQLYRERERLLEENRKLRLERATLQDLHRIEAIALRDLGLAKPAPERAIVVERETRAGEGRLAQSTEGAEATRN